jgi:hypothetical protein
VAACDDATSVWDAWHAHNLTNVLDHRAPRYEGQRWDNVLKATEILRVSSRQVSDPKVAAAAFTLADDWGALTGTQVRPIPRPLFTEGFIALNDISDWCDASGVPIFLNHGPESPITLTNQCYAIKVLFDDLNIAASDSVIATTELNDLQFASLTINGESGSEPSIAGVLIYEDSEVAGTAVGTAVARLTANIYDWLDAGSSYPTCRGRAS